MQRIVIVGAGGHAREVADVLAALNADRPRYDVTGYLVEEGYGVAGTVVGRHPIVGHLDWLGRHRDEVEVVCAVGAPELRRRLVERARAAGARFATVVHPNVRLTGRVTLGEGVVIAAGCTLTDNVRIGCHAHVNLHCTISHDVVLGDFVYVAPGAHLAGRVVVDEGCYVGIGASIIERRRVGAWSVVGAGSAIVRDVPANTTVVGVPGRVIKTRAPGWHLAWERGGARPVSASRAQSRGAIDRRDRST